MRPKELVKALAGVCAFLLLGSLFFTANKSDEERDREKARIQAADQANGLYFNNKVRWFENGDLKGYRYNATAPTQQNGVYTFSHREDGPIKQVQILATPGTSIIIENQ